MSADFRKQVFKLPPRGSGPLAAAGLPPKGSSAAKRFERHKRDYTPIPWQDTYFDRCQQVSTQDGQNTFNIYVKGDSGGDTSSSSSPALFLLHGGGFSGLSWALLSSIISKKIKCQCYSLDIRGHGDSHTADDSDLSIQTLTNDIREILKALWPQQSPPIVLIGHSMGGALAVHAASQNCIDNLVAMVVIDVVEGSALEALSSMQSFLQGRPKSFSSIEQAIEYSVRSGQIRNVESARISMVGQLRKEQSSGGADAPIVVGSGDLSHDVMQTEILEEEEEDGHDEAVASTSAKKENEEQQHQSQATFKSPEQPTSNEKYVWRIDLTKTEKFWKGWFQGLSEIFLHVSVPKLLLLAGVDRLDRELMVGQMQGKFQMQVLPECGHAVHEDSPEHVAEAIAYFLLRNKMTEPLDDIAPPRLSC